MNHYLKIEKIGDVIFHDKDSMVEVLPTTKYPMVGVYSYGKGLFYKGDILGVNTSYKKFYTLKADHIIMSQLFGWEGAIALSSEEYEGKFVSAQFPAFLVNKELADLKFISYFLSQEIIWKQLFEKGKGMGSRRRTLTPENLLSLPITLPCIEEQKRIVDKIEGIRQKINEVRRIKAEQKHDIKNLLFSKYTDLIKNTDWLPMREVAPIIRREVSIKDNQKYAELGLRSFGKGTFHKPGLSGVDVGTKTLYQIKSGDLMFSNVFAWEGAIAVAKEDDNDRYGSHRFISCLTNQKAIADFLCFHFLTEKGLEDINAASPGGAGRNKTLGLEKLMKIEVPIPPKELQIKFVELVRKIGAIQQNHIKIEHELEQLLPSLLDKAFKGKLFTNENIADSLPSISEAEEKYFIKRKVLATYIINQSLNDTQFGSTKFEKILHLSDYSIKRNLNQKYIQKAAGPYDNTFTIPYFNQIEQSQWFSRKKIGAHSFFVAGKNHSKSLDRHEYFSQEELEKVNAIINLFKNCNYEQPEIISTLYAVWNNRIIKKQPITDDFLKEDFLKWDAQKIKYKNRLDDALQWMKKEGIVPDGWGKPIEKVISRKNKAKRRP